MRVRLTHRGLSIRVIRMPHVGVDWTGLASKTAKGAAHRRDTRARFEDDNDGMRMPTLDGYWGLVIWLCVGLFLVLITGNLICGLPVVFAVRHLNLERKPQAAPVRTRTVSPSIYSPEVVRAAPVVRNRKRVLLCEDCVWMEANDTVRNPARELPVRNAYDALKAVWPTWMEDEGADSLIAESVKPCGCCGTQGKGARIAFFLS